MSSITLITGFPGASKTLYALSWLKRDKRFQDKNIFIYGVDGVDYEYFNAKPIELDKWFEAPPNSVILVDEVHKEDRFPARSSHKPKPKQVEEFAELRHYGIEMILITQSPWSMDSFIRERVETHLHIKRRLGMQRATIFEFEGFHGKPNDVKSRKDARRTKNWRFDKKVYAHYKSAEVHTVKTNIPPKIIGAAVFGVVALFIIGRFALWLFDFAGDDTAQPSQVATVSNPSAGFAPTGQYEKVETLPAIGSEGWQLLVEQVRAQYFLDRVEPVEQLPWTSPYYAEVTQPETFPKPRCIIIESEKGCICHTQQSTRMDIGQENCRYFAANGFFDPTIADSELFGAGQRTTFETPQVFSDTIQAKSESERSSASRSSWTNWNAPMGFPRSR